MLGLSSMCGARCPIQNSMCKGLGMQMQTQMGHQMSHLRRCLLQCHGLDL